MRAIITTAFGGPELLTAREVAKPVPGPDEVLVRVIASSANPIDVMLQADGVSAGLEAAVVLGADVSGVVEQAGASVEDLAPGDEVYYTPQIFGSGSNGCYAEHHVAPAAIIAQTGIVVARGSRCHAACRWHRVRGHRQPVGSPRGETVLMPAPATSRR